MGKRKNKSPMLALGVGAAVLAYLFLFKKNSADAPTDTYTPDPGPDLVVDDGTGTGTQVIQPPPIVAPTVLATNLVTAAAIADRKSLQQYVTDPKILAAILKMNDAETISMYNYIFGYVVQGKKLYQYPNSTGIFADGGWDTALFNQITAIKAKYNILI